MVSTKMVNLTVTESINGLQEISIKENSLKDLGKDRELLKRLVVSITREGSRAI